MVHFFKYIYIFFINHKVAELEKKQKNFDKTLAEEKAIGERNAAERDAAEREAREKETRVLSLSRELDESSEKIEELERVKRQLQAELDELVNNQGAYCLYFYISIFIYGPINLHYFCKFLVRYCR